MKNEEIIASLGTQRTDTESKFRGTVTAVAFYTHGSARIELTGIDSTGRPIEYWVNFERTID